jgi:hypothetical protein
VSYVGIDICTDVASLKPELLDGPYMYNIFSDLFIVDQCSANVNISVP